MPSLARRIAVSSMAALLPLTACLPYTVGGSAQTLPANVSTHSASYYFIPNAFKLPDDTAAAPLSGVDYEWRHGLDARSDVAFRVLPGGVTTSYKRRFGPDTSHAGGARAFALGAGVVNGGEHFLVDATLIASGREDATITPYGGVRAMHVIPMTATAVHDRPTLGVFGGLQIGNAWFSVRPELGVFYDHSALGVRSGDVLLVPAITLMRGRRRDGFRDETVRRPSWPVRIGAP
ncbi:MAG TPA: hypothetical protein VFS59_01385 [Gemmatimonadaceae bacterium]|nr:hypothetical protein [Gemmatimonadaceae bacterium]